MARKQPQKYCHYCGDKYTPKKDQIISDACESCAENIRNRQLTRERATVLRKIGSKLIVVALFPFFIPYTIYLAMKKRREKTQ